MNVFQLLSKELFTKNVLCLNILPNAVLISPITALLMEERKEFLSIIILQLSQYGMSSE